MATVDRKASSRPVSKVDYSEYDSAHMLVLAQVANLLREISQRSLSRPQASGLKASIFNPCTFATSTTGSHLTERHPVGINAATASTGGFLHPLPPCVGLPLRPCHTCEIRFPSPPRRDSFFFRFSIYIFIPRNSYNETLVIG